jgi:NADPH-dependent ferric siderophore reductase
MGSGMSSETGNVRVRREPPPFRRVSVRSVETLTPRMARVTLGGPELEGFTVDQPGASVRLLIPSPGTSTLVIPTWNGNEFLLPDGMRPTIRTFTPRHVDVERLELVLDVVVHDGGAASTWACNAGAGALAAVSGPGRGYSIHPDATGFLLAGDETAIPAIAQLLETLPHDKPVQVIIEVADPEARLPLPEHPLATAEWCDLRPAAVPGTALLTAVRGVEIGLGASVWAAGEAAAMHRIRSHLFDDRGLARARVTVRGYWKHGRETRG